MNNVKNPDEICPIVWLLNPIVLNLHNQSINKKILPLSWIGHNYEEPSKPPCPLNIKAAFEEDKVGYDFPVALMPQHVHQRVSAQRSCFTVHGKIKKGIEELYRNDTLINEEY